jgi:F1F0 ATPase subunit 2
MTELFLLSATLLAGAMLGGLFFIGLWWTVRKGLASNRPALWFLGSTLLRTGFALVGFFFISAGDWRRLLICLLGFFLARVLVTRFTRTTSGVPHAPE